jgi:hypothetical protein
MTGNPRWQAVPFNTVLSRDLLAIVVRRSSHVLAGMDTHCRPDRRKVLGLGPLREDGLGQETNECQLGRKLDQRPAVRASGCIETLAQQETRSSTMLWRSPSADCGVDTPSARLAEFPPSPSQFRVTVPPSLPDTGNSCQRLPARNRENSGVRGNTIR